MTHDSLVYDAFWPSVPGVALVNSEKKSNMVTTLESVHEMPTKQENVIETKTEKNGCSFCDFFVFDYVLFDSIDHDYLRWRYGYGYGYGCGCGYDFLFGYVLQLVYCPWKMVIELHCRFYSSTPLLLN